MAQDTTLFIPSLGGQYRVWQAAISPAATQAKQVIQLGNIVGIGAYAQENDGAAGPNERMLKSIIAHRSKQDSWAQLIGPHEIAALNAPDLWTNKRSRKLLRDGWMADAPAFLTAVAYGNRLVTHGGLTHGEWVALGRPATAQEAAELLNAKYARTLYQGACFRLGNAPNFSANPIWAHPYWELYPSWVTTEEALPFDQITGGGSLNCLEGREAVSAPGSPLGFLDKIRYRLWGSSVFVRGQKIISLDLALPPKLVSNLPPDRQLYTETGRVTPAV